MTQYQIFGTLTEAQIEADVAQYLAWCSAGTPFRLIAINEQLTGADKLCDVIVPVYMQFKKSTGLMPWSSTSKPVRKNESPLQEIRRFRHKNNLADNPTLYFQLRAKAKTATDLQHNILLAHHNPSSSSYAVYVAPLTLDHKTYSQDLCQGPKYIHSPWIWTDLTITSEKSSRIYQMHFGSQPFLRNHITIAPHERVNDHRHYYAYSLTGSEISWHSPEILDRGVSRLSDLMSRIVREMHYYKNLPSPSEAIALTRKIVKEINANSDDIFLGDSPLDQLRSYGRWLYKTHGIFQTLLCSSIEKLQHFSDE